MNVLIILLGLIIGTTVFMVLTTGSITGTKEQFLVCLLLVGDVSELPLLAVWVLLHL